MWYEGSEELGHNVAIVDDRTTPLGGPSFWYAVKPRGNVADYLQNFADSEEVATERVLELLRSTRGVEEREGAEGARRELVAIEGWTMDPEVRAELREMFR